MDAEERPQEVNGYCPACASSTLTVGPAGDLLCVSPNCPNPQTAAQLLADHEVHHLVRLKAEAFTIVHPLRERIDGGLWDCKLHAWIVGQSEPPREPGSYVVVQRLDGSYLWIKDVETSEREQDDDD